MGNKSQAQFVERVMAVFIIKTNGSWYEECLKRLNDMTIPQGWRVFIYSVKSETSAAGARQSAMEAVKADIKLYIDEKVWLTDKEIWQSIVDTFRNDEKIGLIGLLGTNDVPTSGIAQNSWHIMGEWVDSAGNLHGEKVTDVTDCLAVDGGIMALRQDSDWQPEIYTDKFFFDTAKTLEMRRQGLRTVLLPQTYAPIWNEDYDRSATKAVQDSFLDEYSKDIFPLVSIIIPTYCRPGYFEEALDSAVGQTYRNIDVFVTDNSPDTRTAELIERKYAHDKRVHYEHHPEAVGSSGNWKIARSYDNKKAEYVQWLMDDDILLPHKISVMVDAYRKYPNVALVTSYRKLIDGEGRILPDLIVNKPIVDKDALISGKDVGRNMLTKILNFIGEPTTVLIKKKLMYHNNLGWDVNVGKADISDFPTWLNLCEQGDVIYLHEPASLFRIHGNNQHTSFMTRYNCMVCWGMMILHAWDKKVFLESKEDLNDAVIRWLQEAIRIMGEAEISKVKTDWDYAFRQYFKRMSELLLEACEQKQGRIEVEVL